MNNQEIAKKVIDALGGRENVNSVAHCATRLRVMVKDEGKINKEVNTLQIDCFRLFYQAFLEKISLKS